MELGKRIAELRKMNKVTQAQLAEYLSVNPQTVSRWEAEGGTPDVMFLPLKLQKQQFRIQMGEMTPVIKKTKAEWEDEKTVDTLICFIAALYDAQRSTDILSLWEQKEVQDLVCEISAENETLWQMMFDSAYMESDLEFFIKYMGIFKEKASKEALLQMEWILAKLYNVLDMQKEKSELKETLLKEILNLEYNEFLKERYIKEIEVL